MAQEHSTVHLHFTDPLRLAAWFYPQSSELIHGAAIVLFKTDWLSPLINLFWLAIALLGCWCIGRPYKVGPATLIAGAIILDSGVMIATQPGEARNDIMGLAFLIAFAAFLINGHQRRAPQEGSAVQDTPETNAPLLDKGPLVLAGIAAGLAASVKTTFLVPVAAIAIGVFLFSGKGRRWTTAWILGLSILISGGYWYVRAAIKTGGNPIPITKFGPLHLPVPDQMPLDPRPRFAVAHYLTDATVYRRWFFPQLENALGPLWPLILIMAGAAALFIVWRSNNKILRVIAAAALLTAVVYVFTPLTAAGQEGAPTGFFTNTRYLIPGLILAMVMLPLARPLRAPDRRAQITLIFLGVVYWVTVLTTPQWYSTYIFGTIFLTLALVWVPTALGLGRSRGVLSRRIVTDRRRRWSSLRRWCWGARNRCSTPTSTTRTRDSSSRKAARRKRTPTPRSCSTSGSGSSATARSSSASTASSAIRRPTKSNTSACPAHTAPTAWRPPARSSSNGSTPATTTT